MSRLRESTIQDKALEALKEYYEKEHPTAKVVYRREACTKKNLGGKRADGLICFEKDKGIYTASLEAKSHRTLGQLISISNDEKFALHTIVSTLVLAAVIALSLIMLSTGTNLA